MQSNKLDFQQLSCSLENELVSYKNDFPKNLGAGLTNYLPIGFGLAGLVFIGYNIYASTSDTQLYLGFVFVAISAYMRFMYGKDKQPDAGIRLEIDALISKIEKRFSGYPDVKGYLNDFAKEYARVKNQKKQTSKIISGIMAVFFFGMIICMIMF